jgi:hypothetical protein
LVEIIRTKEYTISPMALINIAHPKLDHPEVNILADNHTSIEREIISTIIKADIDSVTGIRTRRHCHSLNILNINECATSPLSLYHECCCLFILVRLQLSKDEYFHESRST